MLTMENGVSSRVPDALLADMYRDRKRVFIDLLGWDLPALEGQYEIDQFDGPDTLYLIAGDEADSHLGSIRLLPTNKPTVIGGYFGHLCDGGPPACANIWELSRLCLSPRIPASQRRQIRNRLLTASVLFARANRITHFCCVTHGWYIPEVLSYGWQCRPLGVPQIDPSGMVGALEIRLDDTTAALMAAAGCWDETPVQRAWDMSVSRGDLQ